MSVASWLWVRLVTLLLVTCLLCVCNILLAQQTTPSNQTISGSYDPSLFNSLRWRNVGPNRGGRSIAATGVVKRPLEYYFGATGGGLWKTTDGGTTWNPVTDGQIHSSSVGAVAVSESNPLEGIGSRGVI